MIILFLSFLMKLRKFNPPRGGKKYYLNNLLISLCLNSNDNGNEPCPEGLSLVTFVLPLLKQICYGAPGWKVTQNKNPENPVNPVLNKFLKKESNPFL